MLAIILNIVGVVKYMEDGPSSLPNILTKIGAALAVLGWVLLVALSLFSLKYNAVKEASTYRDGTFVSSSVLLSVYLSAALTRISSCCTVSLLPFLSTDSVSSTPSHL